MLWVHEKKKERSTTGGEGWRDGRRQAHFRTFQDEGNKGDGCDTLAVTTRRASGKIVLSVLTSIYKAQIA